MLDRVLAGQPVEPALIAWARGARYAGSGDRGAVRDLVFQALRRRGGFARLAGLGAEDAGLTGRALMLGGLRAEGIDPTTIFTGAGHAPPPLTPAEAAPAARAPTALEDFPRWLHTPLAEALGADLPAYIAAMSNRAPLWLRVNGLRGDLEAAQTALASEGITTRPTPLCPTALEVTEGAKTIARSTAYADGLVELQDLSPQRAAAALGDLGGASVLDYCAGGGGKALALAAQGTGRIVAHDAAPARMGDLPARAARAGARITLARGAPQGRFDLVVTDVPCSGAGTWARDPAGRWRLSAHDLNALNDVQDGILRTAWPLVALGGRLAYMTCSVLRAENEDRITAFTTGPHGRPEARIEGMHRYGPPAAGDGFFLTILRKSEGAR